MAQPSERWRCRASPLRPRSSPGRPCDTSPTFADAPNCRPPARRLGRVCAPFARLLLGHTARRSPRRACPLGVPACLGAGQVGARGANPTWGGRLRTPPTPACLHNGRNAARRALVRFGLGGPAAIRGLRLQPTAETLRRRGAWAGLVAAAAGESRLGRGVCARPVELRDTSPAHTRLRGHDTAGFPGVAADPAVGVLVCHFQQRRGHDCPVDPQLRFAVAREGEQVESRLRAGCAGCGRGAVGEAHRGLPGPATVAGRGDAVLTAGRRGGSRLVARLALGPARVPVLAGHPVRARCAVDLGFARRFTLGHPHRARLDCHPVAWHVGQVGVVQRAPPDRGLPVVPRSHRGDRGRKLGGMAHP